MDLLDQGNHSFDNNQLVLQKVTESEPALGQEILLNGGRFLSAEYDDPRRAFVAIHFDAGSRHEQPDERGSLHFFEHLPPTSFRLLNEGQDLSQFALERGWKVNIHTSMTRLCIGFDCPSFELGEALQVIRLMLQAPEDRYREVFEIERGRILSEISGAERNDANISGQFITSFLMPGTGYEHPTLGSAEQVASYDPDKILAIGRRFLSAENAAFVVSGSSEAISEARDFYESLQLPGLGLPKGLPPLEPDRNLIDSAKRKAFAHERLGGLQVMGLLDALPFEESMQHDAQRFAVDLLSMEFARRLSFENGLAYSAGAQKWDFGSNAFTALSTSVNPDKKRQTEEIMPETLQELPQLVTPERLKRHYISYRNQMYQASESQNFGAYLSFLAEHPELRPAMPSTKLKRISYIDPDMVRSEIDKYLDPENLRLLFLGSHSTLEKAGWKRKRKSG